MHLINNVRYHVHLTPFSMVVIMQNTQEKPDLQKTKVNVTKITKVDSCGRKYTSYWERMEAI